MYWSILSISILISQYLATTTGFNEVHNHLATRTPYRFIYNKNDSKILYPNCKHTKLWMMTRHGTRMPLLKDAVGMNTTLKDLKQKILLNHKSGKGELSDEQIQRFKDWTCNLHPENAKNLAVEGEVEMVNLAKRMQKRFPDVVKHKYNNKTFVFRHTSTQRAEQSAKYFALGLFNKIMDVTFDSAAKDDPVLRFYKYCAKWRQQVKKNKNTYYEKELYGRSKEMNAVLKKVSGKFGFKHVLTLDVVNLIYKICGFETSWNQDLPSPWCFAFDPDDAQKLEYYTDLGHYWQDGYGYELTYKQACLSVNTMFDFFSNDSAPYATFLFAHSGTLLKVLSHMQLYRPDSHLRGNAIERNRVWKTTNIDCFATNLAFALFKCSDGDHILTLHQEKIVKLPMCDKELCPLKQLKEYFYESIHNCDYNNLCNIDKIEL